MDTNLKFYVDTNLYGSKIHLVLFLDTGCE